MSRPISWTLGRSPSVFRGYICGLLCDHFCRCGSGLSGQALTEAGHNWVGVDISRSMLGRCSRKSFHPPSCPLSSYTHGSNHPPSPLLSPSSPYLHHVPLLPLLIFLSLPPLHIAHLALLPPTSFHLPFPSPLSLLSSIHCSSPLLPSFPSIPPPPPPLQQQWRKRGRWKGTSSCGTWERGWDFGREPLTGQSAYLPSNGSAMLTGGTTILQRDSTCSSPPSMLAWLAKHMRTL